MSRALVLAPHPDDEVLGVGGTIARLTAEGNEVHVGILTRGNPRIFGEETIAQVRREALQAHRVLSVENTYFCDDLFAPGLDAVPHYTVVQVIRNWLEQVQPLVLYLPHHGDIHIDHRVVHHAALVAARPGYSSVRRILSYETLSETEWAGPYQAEAFLPNVFVDISSYVGTKQCAMECYHSQIKDFPNPRSAAGIEALARLRGATVQVLAAEAFSLIREVE